MENKYFTPDIEDFYVGVVYEKFSQGLQIDEFGRFLPEGIRDDEVKWRECTIKYPSDILHVSIALNKETIRVPYLTKEQIEAEGWEYVNMDMCWIKNGIELYLEKDNKIEILKQPNFLYQGECKDINTFRKIIKLLGI